MPHLIVFTCEITVPLQRSLDQQQGVSAAVQFEALTENFTWLWGFKQTPRTTKLYYFILARINTLTNLFFKMIKSQNYEGCLLKEDLTTHPRLETLPEPAALHLNRKGDEVCLRSESPKVLLLIQILT